MMTTTKALPPLPWLCSEPIPRSYSITDSEGRCLAIVTNGRPEVGDLISLSPELLADLAELLHTLMLVVDSDYRAEHAPDLDNAAVGFRVLDAVSAAVTTLGYAASCGLPVDMPGLAQLEGEL